MLRRVYRSLLTWPDVHGWRLSLLIGGVTLGMIAILAGIAGWLHWQPRLENWPMRLFSVLCVPAFTEELVFRGLLVPDQGETRRPALWIGLAVILFMGWHVVEALVLLPAAQLFLQPLFLICAGVLGLGCALIRYRTRSIWPAVLLHGALVWIWQVGFGGPDVRQLLSQAT